jgi:hypothetical protein
MLTIQKSFNILKAEIFLWFILSGTGRTKNMYSGIYATIQRCISNIQSFTIQLVQKPIRKQPNLNSNANLLALPMTK